MVNVLKKNEEVKQKLNQQFILILFSNRKILKSVLRNVKKFQ